MNHSTATELVAALQARRVSAAELLDGAIARIEAHDGALNAVVVRDFERARDAARAADKALAKGDRRPLLGLPITVKEAHNVAGLPTTWGLPGTQHIPVGEDAVAVGRLKAAGAVVIGKTNVPVMLADYQTANPIYGVTNNPWDLKLTPGGSSGGSAVALAAGYVALELGTDLAGSLRVPAHCCAVYAHKPSYGLVPMRGTAPPGTPALSVSSKVDLAVVGPMARSAGDLALALDVIAGPDDDEATAYRLALPPARHDRLAGFRVLVLDRHPLVPTAAAIAGAIDDFAGRLAKAGAKVGRASPLMPDLAELAQLFGLLLMSFVGVDMPDDDYGRTRAAADALPAEADTPHAAILRNLVLSHRDWVRADRQRRAVAHQWRRLFQEWDVVLCPVLPVTAFAHDDSTLESRRIAIDGKEVPYTDLGLWASLATATGLPATALPIGLSDQGLPIGAQAIGPYLEDRTTIAFAELTEREFGGFMAPPGYA